jgi:hypothetical protein
MRIGMRIGAYIAAAALAVVALTATYWLARPNSASATNAAVTSPDGPPIPSKTGPHPKIVLPEESYDFGTMRMGETGKHAFVVRNEGEAPLRLGTPETTCKCTVSEAAKEAIPPGGEATITLEWTPTGPTDTFEQSAILPTNDPQMPELRLLVMGRVDSLVRVMPEGTWYAGEVSGSREIAVTGYVFSSLLDDLEIVSAQSENPLLTAEITPVTASEELEQYKAKSAYRVTAKLAPEVPVGKFQEKLTLTTNVDEEGAREITVDVVGTRHGPIQILPTPGVKWIPEALAIDLGHFPAKEGASGKVSLFVADLPDDEELRFESIETSEPSVMVELERDPDFRGVNRQRYVLTFHVKPGAPPAVRRGKGAARVNVTTNHPDAESMKFIVQYMSSR